MPQLSPRAALKAHLIRVAVIVVVTVALTIPLARLIMPPGPYSEGALRENLARHFLGRHHLVVDPEEMFLPKEGEGPSGLSPQEVYFLGRPEGQKLKDVYFAHFVLSDKAIPVHASPAFNLSETSVADERDLAFDGQKRLAYAAALDGKTSVVTILDLEGLSRQAVGGFTATQRLQQQLTNWQDTGRFCGLDRVEVKLTIPRPVDLSWKGDQLVLAGTVGDWQVVVDPQKAEVLEGPASARRVRVGSKSFLHWAVDTVRGFSFVGPEKIAWLEEVVYGVVDKARRMSGSEVTAFDIKDEMALPLVKAEVAETIDNWPPPALKPILPGPLKGEGQWVEVRGPFLKQQEGMPSVFAMTFVRPDAERLFAKVYFVAWDPRRLELRMVGGTSEPRSATGERGTGMVPREPELLERMVGAFNGGFQTMHGDFGMMERGTVYCPPKPWAATAARLADGSTGMGTWDGRLEPGTIPEWLTSFRQNLTPMVEDGEYNPWRRGSWGGGVGFLTGSGPKGFIIRSGLCLHESGHMMYVMGDPVDGPTLGQTMKKVGCTYGMELDINRGHVGFEFFNIIKSCDMPLPDDKDFKEVKYFAQKGKVPGVDTLSYYMREVVHGTGNSRVPRWLGREARDFFFLTLREMIPGPDLAPLGRKPNEGKWTVAQIPKEATRFPHAMARTFIHPDPQKPDLRVHLVQLDLRWLDTTLCVPTPQMGCMPADQDASAPLALLPLGPFSAGRALNVDGKALSPSSGAAPYLTLEPARPQGPALAAVEKAAGARTGAISVQGAPEATAAGAGSGQAAAHLHQGLKPQAALCATAHGGLIYASGVGASRADLQRAVQHAGCKELVFLGAVGPLLLKSQEGYASIYGELFPPVAATPSLVLRRSSAPWGARIFTNVKPLPRSIWTMAQPERTRASTMRHAVKTAESLGLPAPKKLEELCEPPYSEHKELRKWRWRDPQTGMVCGQKDKHWLRWREKQREKMHKILKKKNEAAKEGEGAEDQAGSAGR